MISVNDLSYTYSGTKTPALDQISFQINAGEIIAVIGANGAGKSSLCYALSGFIPHFYRGEYQGQVTIAGKEILNTSLKDISRKVGIVTQNPLNQISGAKYTVAEEIVFGMENLGIEKPIMKSRLENVMVQLNISGLAYKSPYQLSGGQQQKVVIASVLVMNPDVLILDEPTAHLDQSSAEEIFCVLERLSAQGKTIIFSEHRLDLAARFANRVMALSKGQLVLDDTPVNVFNSALLDEHHISLPQLTSLARKARSINLWPEQFALPLNLDDAAEGFTQVLNGN